MRRTTTILLAAASCVGVMPPVAATATRAHSGEQDRAGHDTFAVIGDVPYGDAQIRAFPTWIDEISAAKPKMLFHVGDIKNGSTRCDDAVYSSFKATVNRFAGPFILTPGDNELTDCHRANNGAYQPLERLAHERSARSAPSR